MAPKRSEEMRPLIVKFRDEIRLPYERTRLAVLDRKFGSRKRVTIRFEGITLEPVFASTNAHEILALAARATATSAGYRPANLMAYFAVKIPAGTDPAAVLAELSRWPAVERAY